MWYRNGVLGTRKTRSGLAINIWYRNGVPGTRRTPKGLRLAPGIQNVAWESCSGNTKNTKWPT
eukprot:3311419-Pyramimonas_sp.AAC.1